MPRCWNNPYNGLRTLREIYLSGGIGGTDLFIKEMGVDPRAAANVAAGFAKLAGFDLPLATPLPETRHVPKDEADV